MQTLALAADNAAETSIAVSDDGHRWALVNATADLGSALREHATLREAALSVVLLDADVAHVAGLLGLRDGPPLEVWATPNVFEDLTTSLPLLTVLQHYCGVRWHLIPVVGNQRSAQFSIAALPGLRFTASALDGAAPPYSVHRRDEVGNRIGLQVEDLRDGRCIAVGAGTSQAPASLETAP